VDVSLREERMRRRRLTIAAAVLAVAAGLVLALSFLIDEPLRRRVEAAVNASLVGYKAHIGTLRFHPLGGSLDLLDATLIQEAHPDPPVARLPLLHASVHWRALLHLRLVADFWFDHPVLNINVAQAKKEAEDKVPLHERGWQRAAEEIYPLKIDLLRISDGDFTYTDTSGPFEPLHVSLVNLRAENIRNVRSRERVYPSEVHLDGFIFDSAELRVDGHADFLAEPHAGIRTYVSLQQLPLSYLTPVTSKYASIRNGTLSIDGNLEYAPRIKAADLDDLTIDGVEADYVRTPANAAVEERATEKTVQKAKEVSNSPTVRLEAKRLRVVRSTLGFVNETAEPHYRVFIADTDLTLDHFSNQRAQGPSSAQLRGKFMGNGAMLARATFRPQTRSPDFDLDVRIEDTDLPAMNDLLKANGNFDVAEGKLFVYTEIAVRNGRVSGYVKPLFKNLKVYEASQDRDKPLTNKAYEHVVGAVAKVLENRQREEVATKTDLSGPLENPQSSLVQVVLRLIQNAFFKAILPGLEGRLQQTRGEQPHDEGPGG
jgi:hypothetical protein